MSRKLFQLIPGLEHEEMQFIDSISRDMTDEELTTFASVYNSKRKSPDIVPVYCRPLFGRNYCRSGKLQETGL